MKSDNKSLSEVNESIEPGKAKTNWRRIAAFFGPAYLVSVGYMDPGNWATDLAGGSQFGYRLIWVLPSVMMSITFPRAVTPSWTDVPLTGFPASSALPKTLCVPST